MRNAVNDTVCAVVTTQNQLSEDEGKKPAVEARLLHHFLHATCTELLNNSCQRGMVPERWVGLVLFVHILSKRSLKEYHHNFWCPVHVALHLGCIFLSEGEAVHGHEILDRINLNQPLGRG